MQNNSKGKQYKSFKAFPYAFKAHCKKQSCSASMKSANADPYTKFSKGEVGVDPRIFAREGRGVETSPEHWNCFTVIIDNKLLIILTCLCC